MSSMTCESIRWPSASTTSCNCIDLSIVGEGPGLTGDSENRYDAAVRRFPAILLLLLFSAGLFLPAFATSSDSKLPACCGRDGQHHCQTPADGSASGALIQAACPVFPLAAASQAHAKVTGVRPARTVFAIIVAHVSARERAKATARFFFSRTRQKRGPPTLLS